MIYREEEYYDMVSGRSDIVLQISLPDQDGKTITIRQNGLVSK